MRYESGQSRPFSASALGAETVAEPESVVITSRTDYELGALGNVVATYDDGVLGQTSELHHEFVPTKSGDGTVVEWNDYYAYGAVRDGATWSDNGRWKYLGKELDNETATQHLDAREYDPLVGIFNKPDRFEFKYPAYTPYGYAQQNPFRYSDASGDTVVVLIAPKGAANQGHMAILIQNEDGKYVLYSKSGTRENSGIKGANDIGDIYGQYLYNSPEQFLTSNENKVIDEETGERTYSEGYSIATTKIEDFDARIGALKELILPYAVTGSNCAVTVQKALSKANKKDGSPTTEETKALSAPLGPGLGGNSGLSTSIILLKNEKAPNAIYGRIKQQNKGTTIK